MCDHLLFIYNCRRIFQSGLHHLLSQFGIGFDNLVNRISTSHHSEDIFYHDPRTANYRLPQTNFWIYNDKFIHWATSVSIYQIAATLIVLSLMDGLIIEYRGYPAKSRPQDLGALSAQVSGPVSSLHVEEGLKATPSWRLMLNPTKLPT